MVANVVFWTTLRLNDDLKYLSQELCFDVRYCVLVVVVICLLFVMCCAAMEVVEPNNMLTGLSSTASLLFPKVPNY